MDEATILIIDDEQGPRESLRMILKTSYQVLMADGAMAGLQLARETKPDMAFVDIKMPEMDGTEVLRRLKDNPRIVIASCEQHPDWNGKSLDELAALLETDVAGAAIRVQADGGASVVRFVLSEDDVRYAMAIPWVATGSDGSTLVPEPGVVPHPRSFGTFPRKLG